MASLPYCSENSQCSDCQKGYVAELEHKTIELRATSSQPPPAMECSVNSIDREIQNAFCFKCLQAKRHLKLEGSVNEPVFDICKTRDCRQIAEYLEKDKGDNYFEDYLLPSKGLRKCALLLGECVTSFSFSAWRT